MENAFKFDESKYLNDIDQTISDMEELYKNYVFILEDLLKDKKVFKKIYKEMYNFMKRGFEVKEVRTFPLVYMIKHEDTKAYQMEIRHMITNFIFWRTFLDLDEEYVLCEDDIIDAYNINNKMITNYINERYIKQFLFKVDIKDLNKAIETACKAMELLTASLWSRR